ncbi:MAG: ABC transporter permease [Lachnospiraceae bacterium]|nr:ABC transporter permease [Lachnospiraceae bacterium]
MHNKYAKYLKQIVPYIGLIAIIVIFEILSKGKLLRPGNYKIILNNVIPIMLGACGLSFLMSMGNFDLSMSGVALISAIAGGMASRLNIHLALLAAVLTGVLIGLFTGWAIVTLHIPDFVGTLAMSFLLSGFGEMLLGEEASITLSLKIFAYDTMLFKLSVLILVVIIGGYVYNFTPFGRKCKAVGARIDAARLSGVNINVVRRMAYMITGLCAGIVAFMAIARSGAVTTATAGNLQFNSLLALMIGGMPLSGGSQSKYRCAIIGSLSIGFLTVGMAMLKLSGIEQQFVRGIVFLIAIVMTFDRKRTEVIK